MKTAAKVANFLLDKFFQFTKFIEFSVGTDITAVTFVSGSHIHIFIFNSLVKLKLTLLQHFMCLRFTAAAGHDVFCSVQKTNVSGKNKLSLLVKSFACLVGKLPKKET